jgi:hypothetical protein
MKWRMALSWPGRRCAQGGSWRPQAAGRGSGYGRERLGLFSLDNVTGDLALTAGSPKCRHAPQNLQN